MTLNFKNWYARTAARWGYAGLSIRRLCVWRSLLILAMLCSLTANLATRYEGRTRADVRAASALIDHGPSAKRQRLDGDAFTWVNPVVDVGVLEAPVPSPRVSSASPPLPKPFPDEDLYNRPPPSESLS
jgi:hypothetical protein